MASASWKEFEVSDPELAKFGRERLHGRVSYFATIRRNNLPRLHPLTPIIGEGHLYVFMEPTSPKGKDLERGSAYALHSSVADNLGSNGEFQLTGYANRVRNATERQQAISASLYEPKEHYILFELRIVEAFSTIYQDDGPERRRWKLSSPFQSS